MRKQINGLAVLVEQELERNPLEEGRLYLFCNRERRILKALYWDVTGFCLRQKRLEKHRFPWPQSEQKVREITSEQLSMLLGGIDFWHAVTSHAKVRGSSRAILRSTFSDKKGDRWGRLP